MQERHQHILASIVKEYTETALPVGSGVLSRKYFPDLSSATIRNAMADLEEKGYLYQPHISSGRIPTDKGYRTFVETMMEDRELSRDEQQSLQKELLQLRAKNVRLARTTAKLLSAVSGNVGLSGVIEKDHEEFYEFGLPKLLEEASRRGDVDDVCRLAEVLDLIDEKVEVLLEKVPDGETRIFIGEENPIREIANYSMVVSPYTSKAGERGVIALIGPKRMEYAKNKSLIEYVKRLLSSSGAIIVVVAGYGACLVVLNGSLTTVDVL